MNREEKNKIIGDLTTCLTESKNIYFTDISGLDAEQTSNLRRMCFDKGVVLSVVKNTLLKRAMDACDKDLSSFDALLKGNTTLMISDVSNAPAKVIKNFRKKSDKPLLKGAYIEEAIYVGDDKLDSLSEIKSKEEMIGEIIGLLQSPAKNVVSALQSGGGKLAGILKTLSER